MRVVWVGWGRGRRYYIMALLFREDALRRRLQSQFVRPTGEPAPLTAFRLLEFDFGWSCYPDGARNGILLDGEGLARLAALFEGEDALVLARSCATPMSRPMVREEAFRSTFAWLKRDSAAVEFSTAHWPALEQLFLTALTDTWSAVRKASARALTSALVPLAAQELGALHSSILELRRRLHSAATAAVEPALGTAGAGSDRQGVTSASLATSAWKAHEGLLLGTTALLRFFASHEQAASAAATAPAASGPAAGCSPGRSSLAERHALLGSACTVVRPTLYTMLAHDQVTVREYAQEAFLASLPADASFGDVVDQDGGVGGGSGGSNGGGGGPPPACAAFAEIILRLETATSAAAAAPTESAPPRHMPPVQTTTAASIAGPSPAASSAAAPASTGAAESQLRASLPGHLRETLHIDASLASGRPPLLAAAPHHSVPSARAHGLASPSAMAGAVAPMSAAASEAAAHVAGSPPLLGDAEAEGLLGLAAALLPRLPPAVLLRNWARYWYGLSRYLAHPASTVRQACSFFFARVLETSPAPLRAPLVRLCLQSLAAEWPVDVHALCDLTPATPIATPTTATPTMADAVDAVGAPPPATARAASSTSAATGLSSPTPPTLSPLGVSHVSQQPTWEWREGRMLALELIYASLLAEHLRAIGVDHDRLLAAAATGGTPVGTPIDACAAVSSTGSLRSSAASPPTSCRLSAASVGHTADAAAPAITHPLPRRQMSSWGLEVRSARCQPPLPRMLAHSCAHVRVVSCIHCARARPWAAAGLCSHRVCTTHPHSQREHFA